MTAIAAPEHLSHLTPDDLLMMPQSADFELVDGRMVERHLGSESSWIAMRLGILLGTFIQKGMLGMLFGSEAGYQCFSEDRRRLRRPDLSFIRRGRLPGEKIPKGWITIAPDLAVEVISPGDLAADLDQKIQEYLSAGVVRVWVVNPDTRTVRVHRPDGSATTLQESDELAGEDALPDFRCPVAELFPPK